MTRINTNVSALIAEQNLNNSNNSLQTTLTRLSTGLRINSAADDPAGMIAATNLGSNIAATNQAISNSQVATQMISTADSALSQISSLLTTINGLVTESANTSSESSSQVAANQLQIDSSLSAINNIAETTVFQGQNLLDGSLGFNVGNWTGTQANVSNLQINQADLSTGALPVAIDVTAAAQQAQLNVPVATATAEASTSVTFSAGGTLTLTANPGGNVDGAIGNGYTLNFVETGAVTAAAPQVAISGKTITVQVNNEGTTTADNIIAALNTALTAAGIDITATDSDGGAGTEVYTPGGTDAALTGTTTGGTSPGALATDTVFNLSGAEGAQVFQFSGGTSLTDMANAVNLATGTTGVTGTVNGNTLELKSTDYGSSAFVNVNLISGTQAFQLPTGAPETRATGSDIEGTINGTQAIGNGQNISLNTQALAMSANVSATGNYGFTVQSGGALFQLGPDVVGSQQAQIGIQSVNTGTLGGTAGTLFELGSGQQAALATNPALAGQIVQQALNTVTSLRGQLGAFQTATLDSNISTLTDAVTNLTAAQSDIQDADFASESANLTKQQILVQSGTTVLGIATSNPANVLTLLQKASSV